MGLISWYLEKKAKEYDKKNGTLSDRLAVNAYDKGFFDHPYENIFIPDSESGESYKKWYRRGRRRRRLRDREGVKW